MITKKKDFSRFFVIVVFSVLVVIARRAVPSPAKATANR
jgi:hypothetical protein